MTQIHCAALLFDMDGVLIDSEPAHKMAKQRAFAQFGIILPEALYDQYKGRPDETMMAVFLVSGIWCLLVLPKLVIVLRGLFSGDNRHFGGTLQALVSTLAEVLLSSIIAPLMLWFQSRAVVQVMLGADGGWSATDRGGGRLALSDAWAASKWIVLSGILTLAFAITAAHSMIVWLIPVAGPMIFAPLVIWGTSQNAESGWQHYLFATPPEFHPPTVMALRDQILSDWGREAAAASEDVSAAAELSGSQMAGVSNAAP